MPKEKWSNAGRTKPPNTMFFGEYMQDTTFSTLNLSAGVRRALDTMGFGQPTPIQARSIPLILDGKDIIGQAQTGTGKTAAFGIPMIELIEAKQRETEALVLCPTRELAVQVAGELKKLARFRKDVTIVPVYGGQAIQTQIKSLRRGTHVVVGTPGRMIDHMRRKTIKLGTVTKVVLDEADEMLNMGFLEDIETILGATSVSRQTLLFSATMPESIRRLAGKYQKNPSVVKVVGEELTVAGVEQAYIEVMQGMKLNMLCKLVDTYHFSSSLIFCNTKKRVDEIARNLKMMGYEADCLHGDMNQSKRDRVMADFRKGRSAILVATDVAARGIDVSRVEAVINYDVPLDDQYYVHRIGRTARMGKSGHAFTLVLPTEMGKLRGIQAYAKTEIKRHAAFSIKIGGAAAADTAAVTGKGTYRRSGMRRPVRKGRFK